jgi:gamma-glutamylcyclotransferase (GGCT)/AIG2-like uncharacterized protein YtfP
VLYIAYGSNINAAQMAQRCPGAKVAGAAQLNGYELLFRGRRYDAVATVEPLRRPSRSGNSSVPVLLWELSRNHERALDVYEGWPRVYRKSVHKVQFEGKTRQAMLYVMNDGRGFVEPTKAYYNRIREGYENAGFDTGYLDQAVEQSTALALEQDHIWQEEFDDGQNFFTMRFW